MNSQERVMNYQERVMSLSLDAEEPEVEPRLATGFLWRATTCLSLDLVAEQATQRRLVMSLQQQRTVRLSLDKTAELVDQWRRKRTVRLSLNKTGELVDQGRRTKTTTATTMKGKGFVGQSGRRWSEPGVLGQSRAM